MKSAAFHNLGCKVNTYELEAVIDLLKNDGYSIVEFESKADVYIINTCSVTNMADHKSRQMINRARRRNPDAIVVAMGCFVQGLTDADKDKINADIYIGNNRKNNIVDDIESFIESKEKLSDCEDINNSKVGFEDMTLENVSSRTRAFIKIQDGCNQFCTYCIIPYARGRVRSRSVKSVVEEIRNLSKRGCKEFVLTGIHVSSYHVNEDDKDYYLIDLIEAINDIKGVERIRLSSLEPGIITEDFVKRLVKVDKICPHFHLSLQSGCDDVLSRMNRKYTTSEYYDKCVLLREYFHNPAITTDVIVGFPQETEEEFATTYDFLDKVHFAAMHIFKYSRRKGTKADKMSGQVDEALKSSRSSKLLELNKKMSIEYMESYIGEEVTALMEESILIDNEKYYRGYSKEYIMVCVKCDDDLSNKIIKGRGASIQNNLLLVEKI